MSAFVNPQVPERRMNRLFDLLFCGVGLAWKCCALGGNEEFCGVFRPRSSSSTRASSFAIRSSSISTKARTAGVISASSSGGIPSGRVCYVVPRGKIWGSRDTRGRSPEWLGSAASTSSASSPSSVPPATRRHVFVSRITAHRSCFPMAIHDSDVSLRFVAFAIAIPRQHTASLLLPTPPRDHGRGNIGGSQVPVEPRWFVRPCSRDPGRTTVSRPLARRSCCPRSFNDEDSVERSLSQLLIDFPLSQASWRNERLLKKV